MGAEFFHILWYIDNANSFEGALLDANTAAYAENFRNFDHGRCRHDLNTDFIGFIDWAGFLAFLFASFGLTFLLVDNGDPML